MTTLIDPAASNTVLFHTLIFMRDEVDALKRKVEDLEHENDTYAAGIERRDMIIRDLRDEIETHETTHAIQEWQLRVCNERLQRAIEIANRRLVEFDRMAAIATQRYWNGIALWDCVDELHQVLRDSTRDVNMDEWEETIQEIINEAHSCRDVIMGETSNNEEETEDENMEDEDMEQVTI